MTDYLDGGYEPSDYDLVDDEEYIEPEYIEYDEGDFIEDEYHGPDCTCELCIQNHPERMIYLDDYDDEPEDD